MASSIDELNAFKALAQRTRLRIVLTITIAKKGGKKDLNFSQLKRKLGLNSNTLDYHLRELASAGLVKNYTRPLPPKRVLKIQGLIGAGYSPTIGEEVEEETKCFSFYTPTDFCERILAKLDVKTLGKMEKALEKIEAKPV